MIFFFNWKNIKRKSSNDIYKSLEILNKVYKKDAFLPSYNEYIGYSYILNAEDLLRDKTTDPLFIYQYIELASKRDYTLYKLYGIKELLLEYYPDIDLEKIKSNPLLYVTNKEIIFKYEEINYGY